MAFELTISDAVTPMHRASGFSLGWRLGGRGTFSFTTYSADGSAVPTLGAEAKLWMGGVTVWAGTIQRVKTTAMFGQSDAGTPSLSACEAVTHESALDKRIVRLRVFAEKTCKQIIEDLLSSDVAGELANPTSDIHAGVTIDKYIIDAARMCDILDDLAARSGYVWFVDYAQNLYFISRTASPVLYPAPFSITDASPNCRQVSVERSLDGYRNQQYIRVSYAAFGASEQTFTGDGGTQQWTLQDTNVSPVVDSLVNYVERISISEGSPLAEVEKTFGIHDIDSDPITGAGDRDFYYSPGEATIWQDTAAVAPASLQTLSVRWRQLGADVMFVDDSTAVAARVVAGEVGTGKHDHLIDDSGKVDAVGELAKAQAILDAKKVIPVEVSGVTDQPGLRPGQILTVALTVPGAATSLLIDTVDATPRDSNALRYTFHASTAAYDDWVAVWQAALAGGGGGSSVAVASSGAAPVAATEVQIAYA
jgi:hypothetical protein